MKNKLYNILLLFIVIQTLPLKAATPDSATLTKKPLDIQFQFAGNLGLISAGVGKSYFSEKVSLLAIYGYLPKIINGSSSHTFALKGSVKLATSYINPILKLSYYTGGTAMYGITRNTYLNYPDYFPEGYYYSNAIHASLFLGSKMNLSLNHQKSQKIRAISFFAEVGTLDFQIWYALKTKYIEFPDIWNLSIGISFSIQ